MKEYRLDFRGNLELDGAEETFLDYLCEALDTNTKEIITTSIVLDCYKNFTAKMENGIELDCEVSWNEREDK